MIFFFLCLTGHFSFHLKMQYSIWFSHKCSECALPFAFNSQVNEHRKVDAKVIKCAVRVHSSGSIADLYQGFVENVSWHLQCCIVIHLKCKWAFILEKSFYMWNMIQEFCTAWQLEDMYANLCAGQYRYVRGNFLPFRFPNGQLTVKNLKMDCYYV
jgi:hypothetical protein